MLRNASNARLALKRRSRGPAGPSIEPGVQHRDQLPLDALADSRSLAIFEFGGQELRLLLHGWSPLNSSAMSESGGAASYTVVTLTATLSTIKPRIFVRPEIRVVGVGITLLLTVGLILGAISLSAMVPAGADLADPTQRSYATNIWQETQTSLALLAIFLPWVLYGLLFKGSRWGTGILLVIATVGTVVGTWLTSLSLEGYAALPRQVTGVVAKVDGRQLTLSGGSGLYLVIRDAELTAARPCLKPGTSVTLWVSPRGHAGYIGGAATSD